MFSTFRVVLVTAFLYPLQATAPGFIQWSATELAGRQTALSASVGGDYSSRETLADYHDLNGSHRFRFIHRTADGTPELHERIEDVVFVQSGEAILQVGGEMVGKIGRNSEYQGSTIVGGQRYPIGSGDIIHIPADTPHRYLVSPGSQVTYVLVRFPAFAGVPVMREDTPILDFEPPGFAMWRASDLARRRAALSNRVGPDRSARETLADYGSPSGSHRFRHIHRDADGVPEIHDDIIDVVFITSGKGELLVGGEMLNRNGSTGSGIAGGRRFPVSAGDVLHIPARTPHGYLVEDDGHVTYVLVRMPAFGTELS